MSRGHQGDAPELRQFSAELKDLPVLESLPNPAYLLVGDLSVLESFPYLINVRRFTGFGKFFKSGKSFVWSLIVCRSWRGDLADLKSFSNPLDLLVGDLVVLESFPYLLNVRRSAQFGKFSKLGRSFRAKNQGSPREP